MQSLRGLLALVAIAFGVLTLFAGGRVLAGADPGYVVFRPLLVFNTLMGLAYVTAGVLIWRDLRRGRIAALAIFLLNLLVLAAIVWLYRQGAAVAVDSLRAMSLRTGVWLALFLGVAWLVRRAPALTPPAGRSPG
ncbi:MAG: hypothetical protein EPO25_15415 [Gammaproteobacteria bacterium]|nr:MAG: hypothetical protein EPO25_15415 [Gammaproteobacteria bacterium]